MLGDRMPVLHGCDVSVYQAPTLVDWHRLDFGIVRATYGKSRDKRTVEHVSAIRAAGRTVGLYHFYRPDQPVAQQLEAFYDAAQDCSFGPGDLVPFVDAEDFPGHQIGPADVPALVELLGCLDADYGRAGLYLTQRDWGRLGKPDILDRPLWAAHYPRYGSTSPLAAPATPDNRQWRIWQCMVGPLGQSIQKHDDPRAVDQNVATAPLPIQCATTDAEPPSERTDPSVIPWIFLSDEDWAEMSAARHVGNDD